MKLTEVTPIDPKGTKLVELPYITYIMSKNKLSASALVIGERRGHDGVSKTTLEDLDKRTTWALTATDIVPLVKESNLDQWIKDNSQIKFKEGDLLELSIAEAKYDYIICISVLEHFGMLFGGNQMFTWEGNEDDVIRWNHDLRAVVKMCELLADVDSRAIITVPGGPFLNYNADGTPWLRYYDSKRRDILKKLVNDNKCTILDEKFYYTEDFNTWSETDENMITPQYGRQYAMIDTPNIIWAFSIGKLPG